MLEQLRALVKLSEIDEAASDIDRELKETPAALEDMKADLDRLDGLLEAERAEIKEAQALQDAYGEQISASNTSLSKAKAKGAKSRNAREVEMAEREMETIRRTIRDREEEQVNLQGAIDTKLASLAERETKLEEFRAMYEEDKAKAEVRIAELEAERAKVTVGRDEVAAKIDKGVVRRYDRIRERYGSAACEVRDGTCTGCRVQIPAQMYIEVHRGDELFNCPQCHRFFFVREALEAPPE